MPTSSQYVTKQDLTRLRDAILDDLRAFRELIKYELAIVKNDLHVLKGDVGALKGDVVLMKDDLSKVKLAVVDLLATTATSTTWFAN